MILRHILQSVTYETAHDVDPNMAVSHITCDSRNVRAGSVFFAIAGAASDGHQFIEEACRRGAAVIIGEKEESTPLSVPYVRVENARKAFAYAAATMHEHPSRSVRVVGITGTNGKTTIAYLIRHMLNYHARCGLVGTIEYDTGLRTLSADRTTPDALRVQELLAEMRTAGCRYCAMEVSSHALQQDRVSAVTFHAAIFTNLTEEHLDYHHTMDDYFASKALLFRGLSHEACAIINADSPYAEALEIDSRVRTITYGLDGAAEVRAENIRFSLDHTLFDIVAGSVSYPVTSPLVCRHNVYNVLAAFAYGYYEGIAAELLCNALSCFPGVPGRMERCCYGQNFHLFIDYAHTPDALENILTAVKTVAPDATVRLIFGCGGDRDFGKRATMGRIASEYADDVILTNDNPRSEDPQSIIDAIRDGFVCRDGFTCASIPDRKKAIETMLLRAQAGDVVLVVGKGHETTMTMQGQQYFFSDHAVIQEFFTEHEEVRS